MLYGTVDILFSFLTINSVVSNDHGMKEQLREDGSVDTIIFS